MKKYLWWAIGGVALVVVLITVVATRPMPVTHDAKQLEVTQKQSLPDVTTTKDDAPVAPAGRYGDYSASLVSDSSYSTTILFFYAGWCPECRGYDKAIKSETVPDGVQILKLNYDDVQDLRKKYGVTIQSTFVRVNSAGDKQALWNGYGREKSLNVILENTK